MSGSATIMERLKPSSRILQLLGKSCDSHVMHLNVRLYLYMYTDYSLSLSPSLFLSLPPSFPLLLHPSSLAPSRSYSIPPPSLLPALTPSLHPSLSPSLLPRSLPPAPLSSNGLLIDHYLCEVNGQNMIGVKDKDIAKIFDESPRTITITIMPKFIYDHLMKK